MQRGDARNCNANSKAEMEMGYSEKERLSNNETRIKFIYFPSVLIIFQPFQPFLWSLTAAVIYTELGDSECVLEVSPAVL